MKKLMPFLISIVLLLLSSSCAAGFTFRNHRFGDTADQIRDSEGEPDDTITDIEGWESIVYPDVEILDEYQARLIYSFQDDELKHIIATGNVDAQLDAADAAEAIQSKLKLGSPDEEADPVRCHKALWNKDGYAAALVVASGTFILVYGQDTERVKAFYDTQMLTSLYQEGSDPQHPGL